MKLSSITFKNWRCFYGEQTLEFSPYEGEHVTMVHAQNGFGKTNLLNAILWTFYRETTGKFEQVDNLLNVEAKKEGKTESWVEICFQHAGKNYRARRFFDSSANSNSRSDIFKIFADEGGNSKEISQPATFIQSVIPKPMAKYFFFDGEHAENFAGENNNSKVGEAVKNILGSEIANTTISDLQEILKKYQSKVSKLYTSNDLQILGEDIEALENRIEVTKGQIAGSDSQIKNLQVQQKDIQSNLAQLAASKKLQLALQSAKRNEETAKKDYKQAQSEYIKWLDTQSIPILTKDLTEQIVSLINKKRQKNKIPAEYQEPVIKGLLSAQNCICGRDLIPHSDEYKKVEAMLSDSATNEQIDRLTRIQTKSDYLTSHIEGSQSSFKARVRDLDNAKNRISEAEMAIGGIRKDFKKIDDDEVRNLKTKETELDSAIRKLKEGLIRGNIAIEDDEKKLNKKREELKKLEDSAGVSEKVRLQRDYLQRAIEVLENRLQEETKQARAILEATVNKHLEEIAHKSMKIRIDSNFNIKAIFDEEEALPKSGGENQLISLLFTAALIEFAKVRKNADHSILLPGTEAPLILDSPFGSLDDIYQPRLAPVLPKLSKQLVLLLSGSQKRFIEDELNPHVGQRYLFVRHEKHSKEEPEVTINGKNYTQLYLNSEKSFTEIQWLSDG